MGSFAQFAVIEYLKTEMDVREVIIRPLLDKLGYTPAMVTTERPLIYKRMFLGRKKPETDRPLRGKADYVCEVDQRLRVVIEAKAPGEINDDEREQAYSYAAHAEIGAFFYVVISGTHFEVYRNFVAPEKAKILEFTWDQREEMFDRLANIISPVAMRRDLTEYIPDAGKPLAPGLRSFVRNIHGKQTLIVAPPFMPQVEGTSVVLTGGSLVRGLQGGLMMQLIPTHSAKVITDFVNEMGITEALFFSSEETISTDPAKPTVFTSEKALPFKEGMPVPSFTEFNKTFPAPVTGTVDTSAKLLSYVKGNELHGLLIAKAANPVHGPFEIHFDLQLTLS